jgi:predicted lipoprotein with Yx(FWY)xxD motif
MRHTPARAVAGIAIALFALAACGSSSKSSGASSPTTAAPGTTAAPATTAAPGTTAASSAATGGTTVALAAVNNPKAEGKKVLVDSKGMTLYVWDNDTTPGKASCTGACAQAWPPLDVTGTPTYGAGLSAAMFSTVTSSDGSKQLAVNGKPLYLWRADMKAGDATGDDVNNFYVVGADGKKIDAG